MSEPSISPFLRTMEKLLEFTNRTIQRNTNAKAVVILVVHEDSTVQHSAQLAPGTELRVLYALRSLGEKIEKGEGGRLEISEKFKN
jgi:hypothetical protein